MDGFVHIFAPEDLERETGLFTAVITLHPHLMGSQGFYGAFWDLRGNLRNLVAYGYRGAMFQWLGGPTETPSNFSLQLSPFFSGHESSCRAHFSRFGNTILSSSTDKTVRIWGREKTTAESWEEVSRPLVHGYPLRDTVSIDDPRGSSSSLQVDNTEIGRIIVIGEEKKCRVFEPTYLNLFVLNSLVETADKRGNLSLQPSGDACRSR